MATLTPMFRAEAERIHHDHGVLVGELAALDSALDRLVCYSEVFANLATAKQVEFYGKNLAAELPEHFQREEGTLLTTVAEVSPELAHFAEEMKQQHKELRARLQAFCAAIEQLEAAEDLGEAIAKLKEQGKELTRELGRHVALEEHELSGFL